MTTKQEPKKITAVERTEEHKEPSIFKQLSILDVSEHVEKKLGLNYLTWSWAWTILNQNFDDVHLEVSKFPWQDANGTEHMINYQLTPNGAFVETTLTINGESQTEMRPVLDHKNQSVVNPNQAEVNTAIKRCFVKTAALFGLGLNVYAGEDLPMTPPAKATLPEVNTLRQLITTFANQTNQNSAQNINYWCAEYHVNRLEDLTKEQVQTLTVSYTNQVNEMNEKAKAQGGNNNAQ